MNATPSAKSVLPESATAANGRFLSGFWNLIDRQRPRLITWNGRSFDAAVLKQRSLIYGLTAYHWHRTDPRFGYDYRYQTNWHCDLMDALSDYGASPHGSAWTKRPGALGLPVNGTVTAAM